MALRRKPRPDEEALAEALDQHTSALFAAEANGKVPTAASDSDAKANRLFMLTNRLYQTLIPVEPSRAFVRDLKARLEETQTKQALIKVQQYRAQKQSPVLRTAVSVFAVAAVIAHVIASIVVVIAFIASRRRRSTAAA